MAGKQLGKLRQWAGEMITFNKEKTTLTDEFLELENDVELRRIGVTRLHAAASAYHQYLLKKKVSEAVDDTKMYPVEALGMVMISHGEEFGDDSAFGQSLVQFGRTQLKLAALQEDFATAMTEGYISTIEQTMEDIAEYQSQRKKLDSRRLAYDAAITKAGKQHKKDKEQKEAEVEFAVAKERYEEVSEDVQARMVAIQENEVQQWHDLTAFLDVQVKFAADYLEIMQDLRGGWLAESSIKRLPTSKPKAGPHAFAAAAPASAVARANSTKEERKRKNSTAKKTEEDSDSDAPSAKSAPARPRTHSKSDSLGSSRPVSTLSRKGSAAPVDKEKDGRRISVAGWATSAVSSVASIGRSESKTTDRKRDQKFADLNSDEDERNERGADSEKEGNDRSSSRGSVRTLGKRSPAARTVPLPQASQPKIQAAPSLASRKACKALFDYNPTAADELTFSVGDEISVLHEVADEWWQGEIASGPNAGRKGLFPVSYVEVVKRPVVPPRPSFPTRSSTSLTGSNSNSGSATSLANARATTATATATPPTTSLQEKAAKAFRDEPPPTPSDFEDDDARMGGVFGDTRYAIRSPTSPTHPANVAPSDDESDDGGRPLMRSVPSSGSLRSKSIPAPTTPGKKAPPPPPPSRKTTSTPTSGPPGAVAPGHPVRSLSVSSIGNVLRQASPFGDLRGSEEIVDAKDCTDCGCDEFEQNKFKPKGYCNSCFHVHALK